MSENVMRQLALDDREVTQRAWTLFEKALLKHMETEEAYVLPAFSRENPSAARAILKDHQKFRTTWAEENLLPENRRSILGRTKRVARRASR